ncbi:glycosyltransferase family 4 protein [Xenorhabdus sp. 12]|uniref:Glycosyltransferase family 4 protein n=1 Tax=Xenorhabdus santafensis TaxID=2582833 RepID=A0ABU4S5B5_9GAMM|nr:glycosyltransferase [Xenorhabdus sp. 12]MDX7986407.1 glycosyltransferase family 4 protein [Xenorhabdus sp. 12]
MKKIVFIITKSEVGGAQMWVYEIKKMLEKEYEFYLITSDYGWLTDKFEEKNVFIIPNIAKLYKPFTFISIAKILRKLSADTVISSSANAGIYARLSKLLYSHKSIYVSHGWSCIYNGGKFKKIFCFVEKYLSYMTDKILCVSKSDVDKAIDTIRIKPNKITKITNSIFPKSLKENINEIKRIIFVGRLTYPKRPELIINVASKIPNITLYIVGDGDYLFSLKQQYKNSENIFFTGEIADFDDYKNFDIFVLCSDSEGLPMSAIEAGSAGLPLLLSNVGGCHELIFDQETPNGILFENNQESLEYSLHKILDNYNLFFDSAQNKKHLFDISNNKDAYINFFEK